MLLDGTDFSEWTEDDIEVYDEVLAREITGDEGFDTLKEICRLIGIGLSIKVEDDFEHVLTTIVDVNQ